MERLSKDIESSGLVSCCRGLRDGQGVPSSCKVRPYMSYLDPRIMFRCIILSTSEVQVLTQVRLGESTGDIEGDVIRNMLAL